SDDPRHLPPDRRLGRPPRRARGHPVHHAGTRAAGGGTHRPQHRRRTDCAGRRAAPVRPARGVRPVAAARRVPTAPARTGRVGGRDVERHTAHALRVYPGRVNLAMFVVGSPGTADEYRFDLSGDGTAWNARLYSGLPGHPIAAGVTAGATVTGRKWYPATTGVFLLSVEPPAGAETGAVNVHVRQRSSGREAVV